MKTLLLGAALALLAACGSFEQRGSAAAAVGAQAPDVRLAWLDGRPESTLHELRGRVVLLEFWRTW